MRRPLALFLLLPLALGAAACRSSSRDVEAHQGDPPAFAEQVEAAAECEDVAAPTPRPEPPVREPPPAQADTDQRATFQTNCGTFVVTLDGPARHAAGSFAELASTGFYGGTRFHRILPGVLAQGGDPTGSGSGGPGYRTSDRVAPRTRYRRGDVAMALAAPGDPGSAGSQFFVVTGTRADLAPAYALVGHVSEGIDTIERIDRLGGLKSGSPQEPVVIAASAAG